VTEDQVVAGQAVPARSVASARRLILPLALAQFICSFAGSNMNVMITDISDDLDTTVKGVQNRDHVVLADHGDPDDPLK
jgi:hypothetical protein